MTEGHSEHESSSHQQETSMKDSTSIASFRGRLRLHEDMLSFLNDLQTAHADFFLLSLKR